MQPGLLRPIPLWEGRPELLVQVVLCCPLPDELCLLPTLFFCASLSDVMISTRLPAVLCEAEQVAVLPKVECWWVSPMGARCGLGLQWGSDLLSLAGVPAQVWAFGGE